MDDLDIGVVEDEPSHAGMDKEHEHDLRNLISNMAEDSEFIISDISSASSLCADSDVGDLKALGKDGEDDLGKKNFDKSVPNSSLLSDDGILLKNSVKRYHDLASEQKSSSILHPDALVDKMDSLVEFAKITLSDERPKRTSDAVHEVSEGDHKEKGPGKVAAKLQYELSICKRRVKEQDVKLSQQGARLEYLSSELLKSKKKISKSENLNRELTQEITLLRNQYEMNDRDFEVVYNGQIRKLSTANEHLQNQIIDKDIQIEELQSSLQELEDLSNSKTSSTEKEIKECTRKFSELSIVHEIQGNELRDVCNELKDTKAHFLNEVEELKRHLNECESAKTDLERQLWDSHSMKEQMECQLNDLQSEVNRLDELLEQKEKDLAQAKEEIQMATSSLNSVQQELEGLRNSRNTEYEGQARRISNADELERLRQHHDEELGSLRREFEESKNQAKELECQLNTERGEHVKVLSHKEKLLQTLYRRVDELKKEAEDINQSPENLARPTCVEADSTSSQKEIDEMEKKVASLEKTKEMLQEMCNMLQEELSEAREQCQVYEMAAKHVPYFGDKMESCENDGHNLGNVNSHLASRDDKQVMEVKRELVKLVTAFSDRGNDLCSLRMKLKTEQSMRYETESQLRDEKSKTTSLESMVNSVKEELFQCKSEFEGAKESHSLAIESLHKENQSLQSNNKDIPKLKKRVEELEALQASLQSEKDALENSLKSSETGSQAVKVMFLQNKIAHMNEQFQEEVKAMRSDFLKDKQQSLEKCRQECMKLQELSENKFKAECKEAFEKQLDQQNREFENEIIKVKNHLKSSQLECQNVKEDYIALSEEMRVVKERFLAEKKNMTAEKLLDIEETKSNLRTQFDKHFKDFKESMVTKFSKTLGCEINVLDDVLGAVESHMSRSNREIETLQTDYDGLKTKHGELQAEYSSIKEGHNSLKINYDLLKAEHADLKAECDNKCTKDVLSELELDKEKMLRDLNEKDSSIKKFQNQIEALKRELKQEQLTRKDGEEAAADEMELCKEALKNAEDNYTLATERMEEELDIREANIKQESLDIFHYLLNAIISEVDICSDRGVNPPHNHPHKNLIKVVFEVFLQGVAEMLQTAVSLISDDTGKLCSTLDFENDDRVKQNVKVMLDNYVIRCSSLVDTTRMACKDEFEKEYKLKVEKMRNYYLQVTQKMKQEVLENRKGMLRRMEAFLASGNPVDPATAPKRSFSVSPTTPAGLSCSTKAPRSKRLTNGASPVFDSSSQYMGKNNTIGRDKERDLKLHEVLASGGGD
eukprot:Nk52_evm30s123 gene=Nk52_evmTU30s123